MEQQTMSEVKVSGTYRGGRIYRANGRWARVLVTTFATRPPLISVTYGTDAGKAQSSETCGDIKTADSCARAHVEN